MAPVGGEPKRRATTMERQEMATEAELLSIFNAAVAEDAEMSVLLAAIEQHAAEILEAPDFALYDTFPDGLGRQGAVATGVKEVAKLFGGYTFASFSDVKAALTLHVNTEFNKQSFIQALDAATDVASMVVALEGTLASVNADRQALIASWSTSDLEAVTARVAELRADDYTLVLKAISDRIASNPAFIEDLAESLLEARATGDGHFFGVVEIIGAMDAANDAINYAPVVAGETDYSVEEDGSVSDVIGGSDVDGDELEYALADDGAPAHGTVTFSDGRFTYTPAANFNGTDTFTVVISDGDLSIEKTFNITITAVNDAPTVDAATATFTTSRNTALTEDVGASDADSDTLNYAIKDGAAPTKGTVTFEGGQFTYTPADDATGSDTFTIVVTDGNGGSIEKAVTINFSANSGPVVDAATATVTTDEDNALTAAVGASDVDGDTLTYAVKTGAGPSKGAVTFADDQFTYTPTANANGQDTFTVVVSDGLATVEKTFTVNITPVNDAPIVDSATATFTTRERSPVSGAINASDVDLDTLQYAVKSGSEPQQGTVTFAEGRFTYTPANNATGSDSFTVVVSDGNGGSVEKVFTINLTANRAPTVDKPTDTLATNEDVALTADVGASDLDEDVLTYTVKTGAGPAKGAVTFADGKFTYTPAANANGTDMFTVVVSDGVASVEKTFTINVTAVNDAPVANANTTFTTNEDVQLVADIGVTDVDGDTLTYALKAGGAPTKGTVAFKDGKFTYVPGANLNGSDKFTVVVSDGHGGSVEKTISININPVNDAPSDIRLSNSSVAENSAKGTLVGALSALDIDGDAAFTYALVDDAGGRFAIQGGNLVVADGTRLDFEQASSHMVSVRVNDAGGLSFIKALKVSLTDVLNETFIGTAGNNVFVGGAGNDKFMAGVGKNVLTGGAGKDTFVFDAKLAKGKNVTKVTDFKVKQDKIALDASVFKKIGKGSEAKPGKLKKDFFSFSNAVDDQTPQIVYNKKNGALSYDADGVGSKAAVQFATLSKNLKLAATDFLIV
ncbi:tandem-95 repeat protein [Microvirga pudoricolor]|uniref:tandem-95 repeat protein n=1 Tax=Microvirga pudoricolor TaxID=2778729 RepID=UPI0019517BB1|nr:Ig-like domain-containing protein [Microvirga pudoricolor]MBM6594151.1 tandem-95 repeat protein [Microvirga pudoricolor]